MFKKIFRYSLKGLLIFVATILAFAAAYYYNNRLFLFEARLLWPQKPFSQTDFKAGSPSEKAFMVVDLIKSKDLIGRRCLDIPEMLGEKTGDYYVSDSNFTYRLTDRKKADWILTLTCGSEGKVNQVFIRKSCCSITRQLLYTALEIFGYVL